MACLASREEELSAWEEGDVLRRIFIGQHHDDLYRRADGQWREPTFEVSWLVNDDADDVSAYVFERDEHGCVTTVPGRRCDSIMCALELEKVADSDGHPTEPHPIWRLPDAMIVRLRQRGQDATEENAEEQLARDAEQLETLAAEREARRGAEATNVVDTSASRSGRQRGISGWQQDLRDRAAARENQ